MRRGRPRIRDIAAGLVAGAAAAGSVAVWSLRTETPDRGRPDIAAAEGAELYQQNGCTSCHLAPDGTGAAGVGPAHTGLAQRAGERVEGLSAAEYVEQSIRDPSAFVVPGFPDMMPSFDLTDEEVDALVEYLLTTE